MASASLLNPLNRMPAVPAQQRATEQAGDLSVARVESTIPKGDNSGNWVYPSPQMFYNALVKKGKSDGVQESNMTSVVAIHNNMNEKTWKQVVEWEDLHCKECTTARKLVRFVGRPDDLSFKAACKYYLGMEARPFDRHDWTVDRCGTEVRYIIDYYDVPDRRADDRTPSLHDEDAVPSIYCDVRPAGDSVGEVMDRARMAGPWMMSGISAAFSRLSTVAAQAAPPAPPAAPPPAAPSPPAAAEPVAAASAASDPSIASMHAAMAEAVREGCADRVAALHACETQAECAQAHIALTMCVAGYVCADEAAALTALKNGQIEPEEAAARFGAVEACVARWGDQASGEMEQ